MRALALRARSRLMANRRYRDLMWQLGYGWGPALRSWLRKHWILLSHPHANIVFEGPVHIGPRFSLYMPDSTSTLIIGRNVEFRIGFRAEIVGTPVVRIGARCIFSYYSLIQTQSPIEIGENCGFGQSFALFDGNHTYRDIDVPFFDQGFDIQPIRIGRNCGVLTKTTVLSDIGDNCQIGANSVVTKPIPSNCVAVGAPAKVIDYFGPEEDTPPEILERRAAKGGD